MHNILKDFNTSEIKFSINAQHTKNILVSAIFLNKRRAIFPGSSKSYKILENVARAKIENGQLQ